MTVNVTLTSARCDTVSLTPMTFLYILCTEYIYSMYRVYIYYVHKIYIYYYLINRPCLSIFLHIMSTIEIFIDLCTFPHLLIYFRDNLFLKLINKLGLLDMQTHAKFVISWS